MSERKQGLRQPQRWRVTAGRAAVAVATVLILDAVTGTLYKTDRSAGIETFPSQSGRTGRLLIVFPGFIMPAAELGRAFAPHLDPDDTLIVVQYADRGIDIDQIYSAVMTRARTVRPARLLVYGASMGGMCAKQFLDCHHHEGDPLGNATLVLDTAPGQAADIKRPMWAFAAARWCRGGLLSSGFWALASSLEDTVPAEPGADPVLITGARRHSANIGTPAITSEAAYMAAFPSLLPGELIPIVESALYLRANPSRPDPLIRVDRAISHWRIAFPRLQVVELSGREGHWHVPLIERPRETIAALPRL